MKCPTCKKVWDHNSKQAIAVELYGECMSCSPNKLKRSEIDKVLSEHRKRNKQFEANGGVK